jgi:heterodisulfide reductase subunit A
MAGPVLVLGGGVTGMQAAATLSRLGVPALLVERQAALGGHVRHLARTFPLVDGDGFPDGASFTDRLVDGLRQTAGVEVRLETSVTGLEGAFPSFRATFSDGSQVPVRAVLVATGYEPFDPTSLQEYGYGRYPNVVTALELEAMLARCAQTSTPLARPSDGKVASRVAILFCIGSRSRRIGAPFCSRICCSYGTKEALLVRERNPDASVFCFYMDVRAYDRGFEEMYMRAQERGVRYIRGRVSSCKEQQDGTIAIRAENTLVQKLFTEEFDLVSLSNGMRPRPDAEQLAGLLGIGRDDSGFVACPDWLAHPHDTTREGIFVAGCATGARTIQDCMVAGASAAARVAGLLRPER